MALVDVRFQAKMFNTPLKSKLQVAPEAQTTEYDHIRIFPSSLLCYCVLCVYLQILKCSCLEFDGLKDAN
jgi:hypothetical protein